MNRVVCVAAAECVVFAAKYSSLKSSLSEAPGSSPMTMRGESRSRIHVLALPA